MQGKMESRKKEIKNLNIMIRPYKKEDFRSIKELAFSSFKGKKDAIWSVEDLLTAKKTFVADLNGEIVGVLELDYIILENEKHAQIGYIFTNPDFWGQGIGRKMVEYVEKYLRNEKIKSIWAVVEKNNERSKRLFINHGYKEVSIKDLEKELKRKDIKRILTALDYNPGDILLRKILD
ncbi:MAG: GNAT family N-acetyltransferase [Candidatus Njordarchaeales archaeon]